MSAPTFHISNLLEKVSCRLENHSKGTPTSVDFQQMQSTDKDFRFMATNDLMTELQKDSIKLDDESERKVVKQLLRLLEDKNGEVQNLAVKW